MDLLLTLLPLSVLLIIFSKYIQQSRRRLPPGPGGLPLIGALLEYPTKSQWLTYIEWGRKYGSDIIYCTVMGQSILVLNSAKAAKELLEERSTIYSDRPQTVMLDLAGWEKNAAALPYGERWRQHRRMFQQYLSPGMIPRYHACFSRESKKMLHQILEEPDKFLNHIRRLAGSEILEVVYGIKVKPQNDPYIAVAEQALESFAALGNAGRYIVDFIPMLRHMPGWLPGVQFKRDAKMWRNYVDLMYSQPLQLVKDGLNDSQTSVVASLISKLENPDDKAQETIIRDVTGTAFAGGSDTTVSVISSFVLAMLLFPDVQKAAQDEIDRVIGYSRLPELEDIDSLPYVTAVLRETARWRPVGPVGVPHRVISDDTYRGYHIPAGTIVIGNVWAMMHDGETFPNPDNFDPKRHLTAEGRLTSTDYSEYAFGFGRRICPGRHFALDAAWLAIAHILAAFNVSKKVDKSGAVIEPSGEFTPGTIIHPVPFPALLKPRSEAAEALIKSSYAFD